MKIVIAGTGYVGLVTGVCFAEKGHNVTCVETDINKVEQLNNGVPTIFEAGLEELMAKNKERLHFTSDYKQAYINADIVFICVNTPERVDGSANLRYVNTVAEQIADTLEKNCVVVVKSTVPIGTNDKIEKLLNCRKKNNVSIVVASNPEFLSQGTAVKDTLLPSRIVIGANEEYSQKLLLEIYKDFVAEKIVTDRRTAEMVKYASNNFLAIKISYINEIANLCELVDANVDMVSYAMGLDTRIGKQFLQAGVGYGGSCFPKDTKALHWLAKHHDYEIKTVKAAIEVNENQKLRLSKKAKKYYKSFENLNIAILGLTFKQGTDDLRESPSLPNIQFFLDEGANVRVWDSTGYNNIKKLYPTELICCDTIAEALDNADLCLIMTQWDEIVNYSLNEYKTRMNNPIVIDGRNCYDPAKAVDYGIIYDSIGRKRQAI